jgi:uncharacterized membrane protein YqiK
MIEEVLIALIVIIVFSVILISLFLNFYKKCPPGSALVLINNKPDIYGSTIKILKSGGVFVWPFSGSFVIFDLSPFSLTINQEKLSDKQGRSIHLNMKILLAISDEERIMENAVKRFSGLSQEKINNIANEIICGQIRSFFAGYEGDIKDRKGLQLNIINVLSEQMEAIGLKIMNVDVVEVKQV